MPRVTDLKIKPVEYHTHEGRHLGSNLGYRVDGKPSCSRVPWVASDPAVETARIERLLAATDEKKAATKIHPLPQPITTISTLEDFRK